MAVANGNGSAAALLPLSSAAPIVLGPAPTPHNVPVSGWARPSPSLVCEASTAENILQLADRCVDIRDGMDRYTDVFGRGPHLAAKPAFAELCRDFAAAFHLLTAACDAADHTDPPLRWRCLVADARILAALEAGVAAANALVVDCALTKFLAENPDFASSLADAAEGPGPSSAPCLEPH